MAFARFGAMSLLVVGVILSGTFVASAAPIEPRPTKTPEVPTKDRPQEVLDAIKRFEGGNAKGAFELLKTAGAKYPNLAPPRVMFANLFFSDNQKANGLQELELAAVEYPKDPESHLIFGDIAVFERRLCDAETQYKAARVLLADYSADAERKSALTGQCYLGLATVAKMRGQWEIARKQLAQLLELQPNNAIAHQRTAETLIAADKPDEALKEMRTAVKADNKLLPAADLMAEVYQQIGKPKEVEHWLTRAVEEAPGDYRTHLALGKLWLDQGELDQAAAELAAAEKLEPESPEVQLWIGTAARLQHDAKRARKYFEAVLQKVPGNFIATDQLALVLADLDDDGKLPQALELAAANLHSAPQNGEADSTFGWINFKLGKIDDAERHLRAAASRGAVSRDTAYFLAQLSFSRGRGDDAQRLVKQALDGHGPFVHAEAARRLLAELKTKPEAPQK